MIHSKESSALDLKKIKLIITLIFCLVFSLKYAVGKIGSASVSYEKKHSFLTNSFGSHRFTMIMLRPVYVLDLGV